MLLLGTTGANLAATIEQGVRYSNEIAHHQHIKTDALDAFVATTGQAVAMALTLAVLFRLRRRSLRHDLGVVVQWRDAVWLLAGVAAAIVLGAVESPIANLWPSFST